MKLTLSIFTLLLAINSSEAQQDSKYFKFVTPDKKALFKANAPQKIEWEIVGSATSPSSVYLFYKANVKDTASNQYVQILAAKSKDAAKEATSQPTDTVAIDGGIPNTGEFDWVVPDLVSGEYSMRLCADVACSGQRGKAFPEAGVATFRVYSKEVNSTRFDDIDNAASFIQESFSLFTVLSTISAVALLL